MDNINIMSSTFGDLNRILRFFDKALESKTFDVKAFNRKFSEVPQVKLARLMQLLIEDEYIKGVEVLDQGEEDDFCEEDYERYRIIFNENAMITVKGLRFIAENSVLAKSYNTVKSIRDLLPV